MPICVWQQTSDLQPHSSQSRVPALGLYLSTYLLPTPVLTQNQSQKLNYTPNQSHKISLLLLANTLHSKHTLIFSFCIVSFLLLCQNTCNNQRIRRKGLFLFTVFRGFSPVHWILLLWPVGSTSCWEFSRGNIFTLWGLRSKERKRKRQGHNMKDTQGPNFFPLSSAPKASPSNSITHWYPHLLYVELWRIEDLNYSIFLFFFLHYSVSISKTAFILCQIWGLVTLLFPIWVGHSHTC